MKGLYCSFSHYHFKFNFRIWYLYTDKSVILLVLFMNIRSVHPGRLWACRAAACGRARCAWRAGRAARAAPGAASRAPARAPRAARPARRRRRASA